MSSVTDSLSLPSQSLKVTKREFLAKLKTDSTLQKIERARCAKNPKYWLWGDGYRHDGYVFTLDTHDQESPIKRLPKKEYLSALVDLWLNEPLLLVPKSRQILCSWLFSALFLWDAQFHYGRYIYFQSKKEDDADYLVRDRAGFILENEPRFLWTRGFDYAKDVSFCKIQFESQKSYIVGIPEGGDQIRSQVPSGLFSDEAAFQPEFQGAVGAVQACIKGGGRFTAVSSANEGYFCELVHEGTTY